MRRTIYCVALILLFASLSSAQTVVTKTAKFQWTQEGDSVGTIHSWSFQLELDNILQSKLLATFCVATNVVNSFLCTAPLPSITTTTHTARIRARGVDGEGKLVTTLWSNSVTFRVTTATTIINITAPKDLKVIE